LPFRKEWTVSTKRDRKGVERKNIERLTGKWERLIPFHVLQHSKERLRDVGL